MNKTKAKRILLVEDDPNLAFVTRDNLEIAGYEVTHCLDGAAGYEAFKQGSYDLCIFDIMLPKQDGISLARQIRHSDTLTPILFLTARSMKEDKIEGFRAGADDYITKPFNIEELLLRIDVFMRRSQQQRERELTGSIFEIGAYTFDHRNLGIFLNGEKKKLTQKEADLLRYLIINKNQLCQRAEILTRLWGEDDYFLGRSLDVFISKLRKYLKEDTSVSIVNHHGVGFSLEIAEA